MTDDGTIRFAAKCPRCHGEAVWQAVRRLDGCVERPKLRIICPTATCGDSADDDIETAAARFAAVVMGRNGT